MEKNIELEKILAEQGDYVKVLEKALEMESGVITAQGWLVVCAGIAITFDVDEAGNVTNSRGCGPHRARRFSEKNAKGLAVNVKNGNGTVGEAVSYVRFLEQRVEEVKGAIERTREMYTK